jgi:hypothetical protein
VGVPATTLLKALGLKSLALNSLPVRGICDIDVLAVMAHIEFFGERQPVLDFRLGALRKVVVESEQVEDKHFRQRCQKNLALGNLRHGVTASTQQHTTKRRNV